MNILVTGAAGFIGSHLCEKLLEDENNTVIGIDGFVGETRPSLKERNIKAFTQHPRFRLYRVNLLNADWETLLNDVEAVYHLAGKPGVRSSWGNDFNNYVEHNILATQRLLEACKNRSLKKFIYASTSSVYGEKSGKVSENASTSPLSPYGVSKLTGEHLCRVYEASDGIPVVVLRYFTVYGPGQRPDMAFHRFIYHLHHARPIPIFGDGKQTRDFTYIDDCVAGTVSVLHASNVIGETINIGGKERKSILEVIEHLEQLTGKKAQLEFLGDPRGEPKHTWANIAKAQKLLNYDPKTPLKVGLKKEVDDLINLYGEVET
jgi:UDP-glucuronate 4-epimerase